MPNRAAIPLSVSCWGSFAWPHCLFHRDRHWDRWQPLHDRAEVPRDWNGFSNSRNEVPTGLPDKSGMRFPPPLCRNGGREGEIGHSDAVRASAARCASSLARFKKSDGENRSLGSWCRPPHDRAGLPLVWILSPRDRAEHPHDRAALGSRRAEKALDRAEPPLDRAGAGTSASETGSDREKTGNGRSTAVHGGPRQTGRCRHGSQIRRRMTVCRRRRVRSSSLEAGRPRKRKNAPPPSEGA